MDCFPHPAAHRSSFPAPCRSRSLPFPMALPVPADRLLVLVRATCRPRADVSLPASNGPGLGRPAAAAYVAVFLVGHMLPSTPAGHPPAAARSPTSVAVVQVKHPLPSVLQITLRGCRLLDPPQISERGTHQYYT
jgi:hypothetical protein